MWVSSRFSVVHSSRLVFLMRTLLSACCFVLLYIQWCIFYFCFYSLVFSSYSSHNSPLPFISLVLSSDLFLLVCFLRLSLCGHFSTLSYSYSIVRLPFLLFHLLLCLRVCSFFFFFILRLPSRSHLSSHTSLFLSYRVGARSTVLPRTPFSSCSLL